MRPMRPAQPRAEDNIRSGGFAQCAPRSRGPEETRAFVLWTNAPRAAAGRSAHDEFPAPLGSGWRKIPDFYQSLPIAFRLFSAQMRHEKSGFFGPLSSTRASRSDNRRGDDLRSLPQRKFINRIPPPRLRGAYLSARQNRAEEHAPTRYKLRNYYFASLFNTRTIARSASVGMCSLTE